MSRTESEPRGNLQLRIIFILTWVSLMVSTHTFASDDSSLLYYNAPARQWVEALPIGNGRLGAMIFGQPAKERLQLNDITIWSGGPDPNADRKDAYKNLPELRRLIREGKYAEAEKFAN